MAKALTTTDVRHSPYCAFEPVRLTMRTHSVQNPMKKRAAKPRERPLPIGSPTVPTPRVIAGSRTYAPNGYAAAVRAWNKPFFIRCLSRRKKEKQRLTGAVRRIFSVSTGDVSCFGKAAPNNFTVERNSLRRMDFYSM